MDTKAQPLIWQRADPWIVRHADGYCYFTASAPEFDRIELRRSPTLAGLGQAQPKVVWRKHREGPLSMNIWAPELHCIGGAWYIYFAAAAAGADEAGCYDHRIYVLENLSPDPFQGAFVEKGRIDTGWQSFSLDATTFEHRGSRYLVWAQRDMAIPGNSNLYIARMKDPFTLELPALMLSRPEYDWECQGFLVNEGPAVLIRHGRVYLTYSASATDERYCMGLLTAHGDADLLDGDSWVKSPAPVMVTDEARGLYGPGHNSFAVDECGRDVLVFHARPYPGFHGTALSDPNRHTYVQPLAYDEAGRPVFMQ